MRAAGSGGEGRGLRQGSGEGLGRRAGMASHCGGEWRGRRAEMASTRWGSALRVAVGKGGGMVKPIVERDLSGARGHDGVCSEDGGKTTAPRMRARGCAEAGVPYRGGEIIFCSGSRVSGARMTATGMGHESGWRAVCGVGEAG
jgi:hypothetical protein